MSETVYRVQDSEGRGPWRPGFSHAWSDGDPDGTRIDRCPPIGDECDLLSVVQTRRPGESIGCACDSIDQLMQWFTPAERTRLKAIGYSVVAVQPDRIMFRGKSQVLFAMNRPLAFAGVVIPWP